MVSKSGVTDASRVDVVGEVSVIDTDSVREVSGSQKRFLDVNVSLTGGQPSRVMRMISCCWAWMFNAK